MKLFLRILLLVFVLSSSGAAAQDDSYRKERRKIWRKWRSNRQSYNPYLEKKKKNRPAAKLARENERDLKKKNRAIRKYKRKMKKHQH